MRSAYSLGKWRERMAQNALVCNFPFFGPMKKLSCPFASHLWSNIRRICSGSCFTSACQCSTSPPLPVRLAIFWRIEITSKSFIAKPSNRFQNTF